MNVPSITHMRDSLFNAANNESSHWEVIFCFCHAESFSAMMCTRFVVYVVSVCLDKRAELSECTARLVQLMQGTLVC